jgi:hypothetical protein
MPGRKRSEKKKRKKGKSQRWDIGGEGLAENERKIGARRGC